MNLNKNKTQIWVVFIGFPIEWEVCICVCVNERERCNLSTLLEKKIAIHIKRIINLDFYLTP